MILSPKNISFIEFLTIISGLSEFEEKNILINYDLEIKGTLSQLKKFSNECDSLDLKRFIHELNKNAKRDFCNVEIMNYLGELTKDFEVKRVKTVLFDMEMFENMELLETFNELALTQYVSSKWKIPKYEKTTILGTNTFYNYTEMINKVFPFVLDSFYLAMDMLKEVLRKELPSKKPELKNISNFTKENNTFTELANNIELSAFSGIEKYIIRMEKLFSDELELQKTTENKVSYCRKIIKTLKQSKITSITPKVQGEKYNSYIDETPSIIQPDSNKILIKWLKTEIKYLQKSPKTGSGTNDFIETFLSIEKEITPPLKELCNAFEYISKYKEVMKILAAKKLINEKTKLSIDEAKSNKSFLASLLKHLHAKGFYKENKKLTEEEIVLICKNTFGVSVSIHTVKRAKANKFLFSFIPIASTIE